MNLNIGDLFKNMMNMNLKNGITLESRRSISTPMRWPPRLMFLASQNRRSRTSTSTVDEQRPYLRAAIMVDVLAIIIRKNVSNVVGSLRMMSMGRTRNWMSNVI